MVCLQVAMAENKLLVPAQSDDSHPPASLVRSLDLTGKSLLVFSDAKSFVVPQSLASLQSGHLAL